MAIGRDESPLLRVGGKEDRLDEAARGDRRIVIRHSKPGEAAEARPIPGCRRFLNEAVMLPIESEKITPGEPSVLDDAGENGRARGHVEPLPLILVPTPETEFSEVVTGEHDRIAALRSPCSQRNHIWGQFDGIRVPAAYLEEGQKRFRGRILPNQAEVIVVDPATDLRQRSADGRGKSRFSNVSSRSEADFPRRGIGLEEGFDGAGCTGRNLSPRKELFGEIEEVGSLCGGAAFLGHPQVLQK